MRTIPVVLAVVVFLAGTASPAWAQGRTGARGSGRRPMNSGPLGVGVQIGAPIGVTAKYWVTGDWSVDLAAGVGFGADPHVHSDVIFEAGEIFRNQHALIRFYAGAGARLELEDDNDGLEGKPEDDDEKKDTDLGPRALVGFEHRFRAMPPLEVYIEAAPGYDLVDETGFTLDGAIGVRWYFF